MKTCYIFGAAECTLDGFLKKNGDLIIAADGGYATLKKLNIKPDLVVGDFDSLGTVPKDESIIKHPIKKNDTDTLLAVKIGLEKGFKKFVIYGAVGGRLDHTIASLQTAAFIAENGGRAYICDSTHTITVIKNSSISFKKKSSGIVSLFALSGIAEGITIDGLLYTLNDARLTPDFPLGVSNEFIDKESTISVKDGVLTIIFEGDLNLIK